MIAITVKLDDLLHDRRMSMNALLNGNLIHLTEHYGNLVTYMRMK